MRKVLLFLTIIFLTTTLSSCGNANIRQNDGHSRVVHLSIDDVELFGDLIRNQQDYDSLFQHPLMAFLKDLHQEYGLRVTLYTYERFHDNHHKSIKIEDMPLKFSDDFLKSSAWLRIGFHSPQAEFDSLVSVEKYKNAYDNVNSAIAQFADSTMRASTLRLHYYFAPDSLLNPLKGIRNLLCTDRNVAQSYNLTPEEGRTVAGGKEIIKNNISFRRTDLRIDDNIHIISVLDSLRRKGADTLVIFAHEWKILLNERKYNSGSAAGKIKMQIWKCINRSLFKETVKWLHEAGYEFSFLE